LSRALSTEVASTRSEAVAAGAQLVSAQREMAGRLRKAEARADAAELGWRVAERTVAELEAHVNELEATVNEREAHVNEIEAQVDHRGYAVDGAAVESRARLGRSASREADLEVEATAARAEGGRARAALAEVRADLRATRDALELSTVDATAGREAALRLASDLQLGIEALHREGGAEAEQQRIERRRALDVFGSLAASAARAAKQEAALGALQRQLLGVEDWESALETQRSQQVIRDELLRMLGERARIAGAELRVTCCVLAGELRQLEAATGGTPGGLLGGKEGGGGWGDTSATDAAAACGAVSASPVSNTGGDGSNTGGGGGGVGGGEGGRLGLRTGSAGGADGGGDSGDGGCLGGPEGGGGAGGGDGIGTGRAACAAAESPMACLLRQAGEDAPSVRQHEDPPSAQQNPSAALSRLAKEAAARVWAGLAVVEAGATEEAAMVGAVTVEAAKASAAMPATHLQYLVRESLGSYSYPREPRLAGTAGADSACTPQASAALSPSQLPATHRHSLAREPLGSYSYPREPRLAGTAGENSACTPQTAVTPQTTQRPQIGTRCASALLAAATPRPPTPTESPLAAAYARAAASADIVTRSESIATPCADKDATHSWSSTPTGNARAAASADIVMRSGSLASPCADKDATHSWSSTPTGNALSHATATAFAATPAPSEGGGRGATALQEGGRGLEWLQGDNCSLRLQLLRLKYGRGAKLEAE